MPLPPLEFLFEASAMSLQDLELAALNRSANLSKVLKHELDLWVEQMAAAMIARWMMDNREALLRGSSVEIKPKKVEFLEAREEKKSA
jgi:hypothetical protein